jgi:radical SAM protein with 4Fe4S-binding SPASM domain
MPSRRHYVESPLLPREQLASYGGLTTKPFPRGWSAAEPLPRAARAAKPAATRQRVQVRKPIEPVGRKKLLRYGLGLWNMLRRPIVMREYPIHLQLESTDACNLNCTTCSRDLIVSKASLLKTEYWKGIIDEMRPSNINVSGIGEPFLHPDIFEIVAYAKRRGATVNCATNFTRLHGNHRKVVECGIDQLKVSIDATNPETFRLIRGEDSWSEIIDNIKQVNRWKRLLKSRTPSIRLNFALQSFNHMQCVELVELARELGVGVIYYQHLSYVDMEDRKAFLTGNMSKSQLLAQLEESHERAKEYGIETNIPLWLRDFEVYWNRMQPLDKFVVQHKNCYMPWISTWLGADGWVRPCPIMPWTVDEGRMGHVGTQTFAEIWNNEKYRELREALKRGERPTRSCKTCCPRDLNDVIDIKSKLLPK